MPERKPLFIDVEGFPEEFQTSDTMTLGGLTMEGPIDMGGDQKITNLGPATSPGDAISYNQAGATLSGLTLANVLDMGGFNIQNMADGVNATDAITKNQLDNAVTGLDWQEPVHTIEVIDDSLTTPPGSPTEGDTYIVASSGLGAWAAHTGKFVTWDGSAWDAGHVLSSGARVILKETGLGGSFTGRENDIAVSDGAGGWSFVDPEDGWAVVIHTHNPQNYWDSLGFTYDADTPDWIQFTGAGQIEAGEGLGKSGNTLFVKPGLGIDINSDLVEVQLATTPGLEFTATSGLQVKIDDTPDTLDVDSDGLKVVGVPSGFYIGGVATGSTVTSVNLDTLTDGSDAIGLHNHDTEYEAAGHTHSHASTTGQTTDDHHPQLHTIASHTDTSATGAELNELTDGSTTSLHVHAGTAESERCEYDFNVDSDVAAGDPVRPTSSNGVSPSDNTLSSCRRTIGIAMTAQTAGNDVAVGLAGYLDNVTSGKTPGQILYIDTPNGLTITRPTATGSHIFVVGKAVTASGLVLFPQYLGKNA